MADIKKIVFYDLTELEIHDISCSNDYLTIKFIGQDLTVLKSNFEQASKTNEIDYVLNGMTQEKYVGYIVYVSSSDIPSGMVEITDNIQTIVIRKKTLEERVELIEERLGL